MRDYNKNITIKVTKRLFIYKDYPDGAVRTRLLGRELQDKTKVETT